MIKTIASYKDNKRFDYLFLFFCPLCFFPSPAPSFLLQIADSSQDIYIHKEEVIGDKQQFILYLSGRQIISPVSQSVENSIVTRAGRRRTQASRPSVKSQHSAGEVRTIEKA